LLLALDRDPRATPPALQEEHPLTGPALHADGERVDLVELVEDAHHALHLMMAAS
jgi:hypothetical protein